MIISYWDCKFKDYEESFDGEEEIRIYGCTSPNNETRQCDLINKYGCEKDECPFAEKEQP